MNPGAGYLTERYKKANSCKLKLYGDSAAQCYNCIYIIQLIGSILSKASLINLLDVLLCLQFVLKLKEYPFSLYQQGRKQYCQVQLTAWPICVESKCSV